MANEKIMLNAKAKTLGIEGYRQMTPEALKSAIAKAEGRGSTAKGKTATSAPAKGKTAAAPKGKVTKTAEVSSAPAKGKTASKSSTAPAKGKNTSKTQKSEAAPAKAAKGAASRAASAKPKTAAKAAKGGADSTAVVNRLDLKGIDWKAECGVGKTGKRAEVLSALKKTKNYGKAFALLQPNAKKFYPGKDKHAAERMLVWLIGRVAYDFATATGQHEPGVRAAYGTSERPQDVKRRENRAANSTPKGKTAVAKKTTKKAAPAKKTATKATAPKPKGGKTQPAKGGTSAAKKGSTAKGKSKR